jgi:hypothetical protein
MRYEDGHPVLSGEESRSGSTEHVVRYVLVISLALAIVAMTLIWVIPVMESRGAF